jgi:hypothetical protein
MARWSPGSTKHGSWKISSWLSRKEITSGKKPENINKWRNSMKKQNTVRKSLSAALITAVLLTTGVSSSKAKEQTIHERMIHHRAIDAVVWAMPLLNFKTFRDGHRAIGVDYNDIAYNSKVQDWKFQTATPNDTTPYVNFFWNVKDGPVVVEIPPSAEGVGIFGTLMDAWQRPLEDVGAKGKDGGLGAKYVMVPNGYDGELLPGAHTLQQRTHNGFAILRPIIPDSSPENIAKATAFARKIKVYPLAQAENPPDNRYVDIYGKNMEGTPKLDKTIYSELNEIIQEEVVDDPDLAMMGLLNSIGIQKGKPFKPDAQMKKIYSAASADALQYMIEQYHKVLNPPFYEGKKWSTLMPPGVIETGFTYEFTNHHDYHARGCSYYAIISSVKNYGTATFYLDLAEDKEGNWLDGNKNYKLKVPANVPAKNFWSVVAYDLETAAWIREMPKVGIDSNRKDLQKNSDGSVDIYFGPKAPKGKESNWIPTAKGRKFFLLFRFYGPEPSALDRSWELNDIELVE